MGEERAGGVRLTRGAAAVLVVDVQERLCAAMEARALASMVRRTRALLEGARALGLPVLCTEQYPKGLGRTLPELAALMPGVTPVEKLAFSAAVPTILEKLQGKAQVLIAGMETHVCVFQTVRDLSERGLLPILCADAVLSRMDEDRQVGLSLCREAGGRVFSVEAALFDLLGQAGTPEFKLVSAAVK